MEERFYNVVFLGPAHNDVDYVNKVTAGLLACSNLPIESVTKMMMWAPLTVKKGLTFKEAANYRIILESVGARIKLEPMDNASGDKPVFRHTRDAKASKRKPVLLIPVMAIVIALVMIIMGLNMIFMYRDSGAGIESKTSLPDWKNRKQSVMFVSSLAPHIIEINNSGIQTDYLSLHEGPNVIIV